MPAFARIALQAEVLFGFDKANLKDEGKKILDVEVVEKMKAHPEVELVLITGHTDRIGDDKYNQKLSERRAMAVKNWLTANGIAAARLEEAGYGEAKPKYDNKTEEGRRMNRRVEIQIIPLTS